MLLEWQVAVVSMFAYPVAKKFIDKVLAVVNDVAMKHGKGVWKRLLRPLRLEGLLSSNVDPGHAMKTMAATATAEADSAASEDGLSEPFAGSVGPGGVGDIAGLGNGANQDSAGYRGRSGDGGSGMPCVPKPLEPNAEITSETSFPGRE
ncbi:hypothetical protein MPH_08564 [Macrophomina phaseolina MS6]|uniref:Uncharacterized protein n=1 Tax=Macrophomina phaseolina (strain MS6) TaxID=1126212 RepID=K2RVP7_MACPH|nr:hypothetical protein MPH_08564 [Macrophomina phaseolina MS6]